MSDTKDLSELEALLSEGSFDKLFTLGPSFASGAFSTIHRATKKHAEEDEEKEYVVKVVQTKFADEIREVTREVRCLREVAHANLVEFGGCWLFEKQVYLVLENCHIGSLASIYEETDMGFDDEFIKFMAREILRGLAYLHSKQIVHRDLKCANVLMNEDGEIKIADLGTVGRLDAGKKRFSLVGTPHWMSPEVCKNNIMPNAYGTAADIWALGITCIEAAELDPPHGEEDEVLNIIATTKAPPTFADPSCRMKELQEFVAECLTVIPAERKTASELLLHHFFDEVDEDAGMVMAMDVIDRREKTAKLKPPTPVVHIEVEDKTETTTQPEEPKSVTTIAPIPEQSTHDASADPDEGTLSTASSVSSVRAAKESTDQLHDKEPVRKRDSASSGNTPSERHTSSDPSAPPVAVTASETKKDDKVKTRGRRTSSLTGKAKDKKKGKGSQEEPAPAPRDDKKESARIKLAKKETKAAQRKKLMTPLALDKLPVMTDTGSNSGKATTPKIGAATPRARARLGNVTTRKATDNLPPEAQPFACILENRKDNNKAYEKDNKLLRDLTALQTKQRKAAEKQTKPLKDIVDDIKAELASIESEIEKKYAELKSASDVEYDKKTIENNAYKLETEQSIEKEFAAATAELEQKFASDKEAAAGDEAALLDVQLKHCDASLDLTLNHFTKQQDCALEMLDRIHAASYPYNLATQELRLKQHEETNLSERLQATRAKLREATKSLAQAHQSLARDNLKEKHKLTNVQESIKIAKKVLKDAFEKQVEVLEEKHNARLKQLKEQHKDDKKVQKTEMAAELSRYKKTIKDGEIWFTEYLLTVGEKTSQSIASNQQMELELLATALEEAAVLEQKEFDAVEEAKREKYKSAHEQMTKILLLKQVDGKFQHELSIINCNEAFEIKKITAEFDNRKKKDEIELAYVQAHLSDEKLKEEMSEKEAEIKKSMDAWQDDLDEEIGITEENAEGDRNNLKFVKYPTVGMTKLGVKVGDCETLAKKVEVEANK